MNQEKIGKYMAKCRRKVNLTQEELAELMGVTAKSVSKWECGICLPDIYKLQDLCYYLKTNLFNLLNGEDTEYKYYITKVGGNLINKNKKNTHNYQVKYSNLASKNIDLINNIDPTKVNKYVIKVKILGLEFQEIDGVTFGHVYATDESAEINVTLCDNGSPLARAMINNIIIGNYYYFRGFIFDDTYYHEKRMIAQEMQEVGG